MPRPPQTTANLKASGALKHDPKRYANRALEAPPTETVTIYDYPKEYSKEMRVLWKEVVNMPAPGVLTKTDKLIVERLCYLVFKSRNGTLSVAEGSQYLACLAKIEMSPADRLKVRVCDPKFANPRVQLPRSLPL
jgi:hypothetical protein